MAVSRGGAITDLLFLYDGERFDSPQPAAKLGDVRYSSLEETNV
jgi:hypothetical protein